MPRGRCPHRLGTPRNHFGSTPEPGRTGASRCYVDAYGWSRGCRTGARARQGEGPRARRDAAPAHRPAIRAAVSLALLGLAVVALVLLVPGLADAIQVAAAVVAAAVPIAVWAAGGSRAQPGGSVADPPGTEPEAPVRDSAVDRSDGRPRRSRRGPPVR